LKRKVVSWAEFVRRLPLVPETLFSPRNEEIGS
jgi:hypothetical protein